MTYHHELTAVARAVEQVGAKRRELLQQVESRQQRREGIANAPPARAELKWLFTHWVETLAADYEKDFLAMMAPVLRRPDAASNLERFTRKVTLMGATRNPESMLSMPSLDWPMAFLFKQQLISAVLGLVDRMPEGGLPQRERKEALDEIDREIDSLLEQLRQLDEAAAGAGLAAME